MGHLRCGAPPVVCCGGGFWPRFSRRPIRVFQVIAPVVLLLSLVPIPLQGVVGPSAGALALMHVVAATVVVGVLTALLAREKR